MVKIQRKRLSFGGLVIAIMFLINLSFPVWAADTKRDQTQGQQIRTAQKAGTQQEKRHTKKKVRQKPAKKGRSTRKRFSRKTRSRTTKKVQAKRAKPAKKSSSPKVPGNE
jgi:hypothetical protein